MPKIRLPRPLPHQIEVLRHPARKKLIVSGRRWGKTTVGLLATVEGHGPPNGGHLGAVEGGTIWWVAPSFPIASLIWRDLKTALRTGWTEKSENERRIVLPGGGSVTVKSADNPDSLRGVGLDGVVLDEAAFMKQEAWSEGIRPALADRQGWALFLTTPCGMNWLYDLYLAAEQPGWARWQRPTSDNPRISPAELEAAKAELGSYSFGQEFEAQFLTPGGGIFKPEWFSARWERRGETYLLDPLGKSVEASEVSVFATVDLAVSLKTTADYSVIAVFGRWQDHLLVLEVDRARREGPDLVPAIRRAAQRWGAGSVWVEKAGFQLALVQEARREGLPVRELQADRDKVSRAIPATAALEAGRVFLPRQASWLRDFETELLAFPNGPHDDQVDAFAYGVEVARRLRPPPAEAMLLVDRAPTARERERAQILAAYRPARSRAPRELRSRSWGR